MAGRSESFLETVVAGVRSGAAYVTISTYVLVAGPLGIAAALAAGSPAILYRLGLWGVRAGLFLTGIRATAEGTANILVGRAAVYCVNHTSNVEPPVLFLVLRSLFPRLRILYKAELKSLPILARGFDIAGFVPVERRNREQSMAAIDQAAQALREGNSFLIFPEGTRSRTGELLPFKKGGFIMALKAQVPIVPVAIVGARAAMRKGSPIVRPVRVVVRLGEPVDTTGLELDDRDVLIGRVRERMEQLLLQSNQEPGPAADEAAS
jgi:1-acyl-sn-glycerol-3-phosphate acyltransferase